MSVPRGWAVAAPEIRTVASVLPMASASIPPAVLTGSSGTLLSEMALASMAGRAVGGAACMGGRAVSEKRGDTTDYRAQIAATFGGGVVAGANKGYRSVDFTDRDPGEGQLLEQVANRYPAVFALLGALCSPNENSEAGLAKLEHEIRALAGRFTAGP
jgi:hypothetical protein